MTEEKKKESTGKMNILDLLKNIWPFVKPYRGLISVTLALTLVGSLMAQVNAVVLDRAVDAINALIQKPQFSWGSAVRILTTISIILLGKEVIAALVTFFQRYFGERMRILVSRDLSVSVVKRMLSFRMQFFTSEGNETGKLQSRIDRGIMSLSNTVNNFFIEILPLFTSAILALILMFMANVYVGLVALCIVPIYFWVTYIQAKRMKGGRRGIFGGHQAGIPLPPSFPKTARPSRHRAPQMAHGHLRERLLLASPRGLQSRDYAEVQCGVLESQVRKECQS